jgi:glutathione reductase (NADPH)
MSHDFDLFVIGAGSGGVRAARRAAQYGANVAIAEQSRLGGTCVIRGCVPKKLMVYGSEFKDTFEDAAGYGWTVGETSFDWATLRDNIASELDRIEGIYGRNLDNDGVTLFDSRAVIKDPHTVHIVGENRDVTAGKILIAVGGTPMRDDAADPDNLGIVSDDVFDLPELPKRLVVAGGGYIAIEFAHVFKRLGSDVTLVYRADRLLKAFDPDISSRVRRDLDPCGVRFIPDTVFTALRQSDDGIDVELINGEVLKADQVLWAIGRKPMTMNMGLDYVGVETDEKGAVQVDEDYRTNVPSIFAIGDATNRVNLTPVAIREGDAFASTQFGGTPKRMDYHFIPKAVFAQPPVGSVGPSEQECTEAGHEIDVYEADFRPMKNVLAGRDERMFIKLIVDRADDRVLGCHMVGEDAPELVQIVAIAIKAGLTKAQFDDTCALHPTVAEELVTMRSKRDN